MVALSALVSGLDAELMRLGYKDSTMVWYRGCWRRLVNHLRTHLDRRDPRTERKLCAADGPQPRSHQARQANAAHNPALFIRLFMRS